ncbi:MAG: hypothetical protein LLG37_00175 [Spirochaetia bacterium]|nr:hypothetical protein [Spirochaetia bacterium]
MSLLLAGYTFSGPVSLVDYKQQDELDGLFGAFYLKHPDKKVADYGLLYIGDTEEIKQEGFPEKHKKYQMWVEKAKGVENIYIGFCPTPGLMPKKKELIKRHLIYKYNPMCNK